jgi:hypothetical protein
MTTYLQETDSKVVFALRKEDGYPTTPPELQNETYGGSWKNVRFIPFAGGENPFREVWILVRRLGDQNIAEGAERLLQTLQEIIGSFQQFGFELAHLPPLHAFLVDDGSILLEWIFPDFRIGFSFEPSLEDSGWYLVSTKKLGEISASGYLSGIDLSRLVMWLVNFVLSHS